MNLDFQNKYDELINSLPDGIFVINENGQIILANQSAAEILGYYGPSEFYSLTVDTIYANTGDHDALLSILGHRGYAERSLFDWRKKDGSTRLIEVSAIPLRNAQGKIGGIQAVFRDISRRLENQIAQQETIAEAASRAVDADRILEYINFYRTRPMSLILQGVAHNLNTPLGSMRGRAELLLHQLRKNASLFESVSDEKLRSDLDAFRGKLEKGLNEVIGQVDKASLLMRGFSAKVAFEMQDAEMELDINAILQNEFGFFESSLYFKHQIQKEMQYADKLPMIKGIYRDFSQAFHNIIIHCIKATAAISDRWLYVKTELLDNMITVTIRDNRVMAAHDSEAYHGRMNLETRYSALSDENFFSMGDIELFNARQYLAKYQATMTLFPNGEPKIIVQIPRNWN